MAFGRLLLTVLLFCCSAFSQDHLQAADRSGKLPPTVNLLPAPAASASEPSRIIPKAGGDRNMILHSQDVDSNGVLISPDGPDAAEATCYTIRAYVVARDSKNSDSTHPVEYSTCHAATRYRLKSAQVQDATLDR